MDLVEGILLAFACIWIILTLLPLMKVTTWWIRVWDAPRMQILILGMSTMLVFLLLAYPIKPWHLLVMFILSGCMVYQMVKIYPFTIIAKKQTIRSTAPNTAKTIEIVISNVRMKNKETLKLQRLIEEIKPHIFLTVENNQWWDEQLSSLDEIFPYSLKHPLENTYGMSLYSRLELIDPKLNFYLSDDIPSIITEVKLDSGDKIKLYCVHPEPPQIAQDSDQRDAEILMAGKSISQNDECAIIVGDLNDVGWSHTTRLFRKVSEMLDPRVGRGMYNTYNANIPFFRWPLDHLFHTDDFKLVRLERLPHVGSDHFPIHATFELAPEVNHEDVPHANGKEMEEAEDRIQDGIEENNKQDQPS